MWDRFLQTGIFTAGLLAGIFILLLLLGRLFPLRRATRPLARRLPANLMISALAFLVGSVLVRPAATALIGWPASTGGIGILRWSPLPTPVTFCAGFLLMDLSFYWWHRANHRFGLLWRFHNVHHVDLDLDVTTSFRFHFGEMTYSTAFRALQVLVIGMPLAVYLAYDMVFVVATMFHHSNVRLPIGLERALNWVIVTPRMHGIHHSVVGAELNSNYSVIFRWWDMMHRSLRVNVPQSQVVVGVAGYRGAETEAVGVLMAMPFREQRDYWHFPDGTQPQRRQVQDTSAWSLAA
jgi:sterol desaturase/sphingolipid hydroxylase (fatty acid hydroxylase superfamily)